MSKIQCEINYFQTAFRLFFCWLAYGNWRQGHKGKIIFYSLGNFVFDQLFSEKTQQELAVGAVFEKGSMEYYLFPLESKNIQINLLTGDKKDIILKDLAAQSEVSDAVRKQIENGKILIEY